MQVDPIQDPSRMKPKRAKRELIDVHGGTIVRSNGRKDKHSKVCTARGPRDRRVRLSPHTAIRFYDVQDRLGYDRPSKAIDWLMKEAKLAIDALDESNYAAHMNPTDFAQYSDHGFYPLELVHENRSSKATFFSQDYFNQMSHIPNVCNSFCGINGATTSTTSNDDYINILSDDHLRNKYQTQGLSLSFHSSQDFSPFHFQQESSTPDLASDQRLYNGISNSRNAKEGDDSALICLPFQFPSVLEENNMINSHREPLQSTFSAPAAPFDEEQHYRLNYASSRFSNDGILGISSAHSTFHGAENRSQVSCKPASPTAFVLHYQE